MTNFIRHGDVNLHEITEEEFNTTQDKIIEHDGSYILARGEATGSKHVITASRPQSMSIKIIDDGRIFFGLFESATITHTHDHETITTPKRSFYVQVPEREMDHFAESLVKKVID